MSEIIYFKIDNPKQNCTIHQTWGWGLENVIVSITDLRKNAHECANKTYVLNPYIILNVI